jgi:glycosyltransferase involved in cell wall biosynthesis
MLAMMWMQGIRWLRPRELVLTFYGSEIQRFHRNPIIRMMVRRLIRQSNRVGVITAYTRGLLESHFPESRDKIVMTPCALPTGFTAPAERAPPSPDQVILLTVSRLHPRKGHLITLDALRALPESLRHKIAYWVVGTGKPAYERQLEEAAGTCDFPIKFWGGLTDRELQQVYRDASIFVMTSVAHGPSVEGFGLVYLEASSHGVPVVAHDVGGVSEAVADGYSGVLVPANDPATLTEQLTRLIEDPELRHQLGSNGRKWAQEAQWSTGARALYGTPNG